jgi:Leucine-rich repeat (LRR) protein
MKPIRISATVLFLALGLYSFNKWQTTDQTDKKTVTHTFYSFESALQHPSDVLVLDLSNQGITEVPKAIAAFTNLRELNLSNNKIKTLPEELGQLNKLKELNLSRNYWLDLRTVFASISDTNKIERLDLSKCNLTFLPFKISTFPNLRQLDLNHNYIGELPYEMAMLKQLESVDLSHNEIIEMGWSPSFWGRLKHLDVSHNASLNADALFMSLAFLKNLQSVKMHGAANIGDNVELLTVDQLELNEGTFETLPEGIERTKMDRLVINDCENLDYGQAFKRLGGNPYLESLTANNDMTYLPEEVSYLQNVFKLNLSGNEVAELDGKLNNLHQLQKLDIRYNPLVKEEVVELAKKLPDCNIVFNNFKRSEIVEKKAIAPPIENINIVNETYKVDPSVAQTIKYGKTDIDIPSNAFLDKNGNVVTGEIDVEYREFNDPLEVMLSGIPMSYDSAGGAFNFQSAGMVEFNASQNGEKLYANPKSKVVVNLASAQADNDYNLYFFNEKSGRWEYNGVQDSVNNSMAGPSNVADDSLWYFRQLNSERIRPRLYRERVMLDVAKQSKLKSFSISLSRFKTDFERHDLRVGFPELGLLNQFTWVYDGDNTRQEYYLLDSLSDVIKKGYKPFRNKKKGKPIKSYSKGDLEYITEVTLTADRNNDNYNLQFNFLDTTFNFPVYPTFGKVNLTAEREQQLNATMHTNYNKIKTKNNRERRRNQREYEKEMEAYENWMTNVQSERRRFIEANNTRKADSGTIMRSFAMDGFGVWNCDRIQRMKTPERLIAKFINEQNKTITPSKIYILDETDNGVLTYNGNETINYDASSKNAIITFFSNSNSIGYIKSVDFQRVTAKRTSVKTVPIKLISNKKLSVEELRKLVSS